MTRLHIVPKRRKGGIRWYVYAWRGGPQIYTQDGAKPVVTVELQDKARAARLNHAGATELTLDTMIDAYRASPQFEKKADSTKRDYRYWLDRISERFGPAPLAAFAEVQMRGDILDWRDRWASQPRTADKASVMMATLLAWIVDRGKLPVNVAAGIEHLHSVDKSDEIWERRHMRAFANKPAHLRDALKMAGLTGLRLGDLVRLDWSNVQKTAIILTTRKRKGRAVIPITRPLRKLLDKRAWREGPVLQNSRGAGWTESGLGGVFQKAKPAGFDRTMHDLRGTFATRLILAGLTDEEAALVMGWTAKRIAAIRARYVNEERVIISIAERLSA